MRASKLPVSIIIAGIGNPDDDFKYCHELDGDKVPLKVGDEEVKRDCVQFVSLRDC